MTEISFAGFLWRKTGLTSPLARRHYSARWVATWYDGRQIELTQYRERIHGRRRYAYQIASNGDTCFGQGIGTAGSLQEAMATALVSVARRVPHLDPVAA